MTEKRKNARKRFPLYTKKACTAASLKTNEVAKKKVLSDRNLIVWLQIYTFDKIINLRDRHQKCFNESIKFLQNSMYRVIINVLYFDLNPIWRKIWICKIELKTNYRLDVSKWKEYQSNPRWRLLTDNVFKFNASFPLAIRIRN